MIFSYVCSVLPWTPLLQSPTNWIHSNYLHLQMLILPKSDFKWKAKTCVDYWIIEVVTIAYCLTSAAWKYWLSSDTMGIATMSMMRLTMLTTMIAMITYSTTKNPSVYAWTCTKVSMSKNTAMYQPQKLSFRMNCSQRVDKVVKVGDRDGNIYSVEQSPPHLNQVSSIFNFFLTKVKIRCAGVPAKFTSLF